MARFFQIFGICLLIAFVLVMTVGVGSSIEGKWTCIQGGHFANFSVSPTGAGAWQEIEFSDDSLILEFANGNVQNYPYKIIGDGYMNIEGYTLKYKVENWQLHIYEGSSECIFEKSW